MRHRDSRVSWRGEWEMLHLGGPAALFLLRALATLCCVRVRRGAGSLLNGCLLVPCPARAPQDSARHQPLPRLWDESMSILMHALQAET